MDEVQDTTSNNAGCPQAGIANEDCLSLNVFSPQVKIIPINTFYFFLIFNPGLISI
jgi:carboxylesterase type B